MKVSPKQYAQSLFEAMEGKSHSEIKVVIENFVNVLVQNNDIIKADKIIEEFIKIINKEDGLVEAEIISARKLDEKTVKEIEDYIIDIAKAKKAKTIRTIDENILGGVIIKYGDKIIDAGLRTRVGELKRILEK